MSGRAFGLGVGATLSGLLAAFLLLPLMALVLTTRPGALVEALFDDLVWAALGVSLRATGLSLLLTVVAGTPLAWWLGRSRGGFVTAVGLLVELPIMLPPAALGVGLLLALGRDGLLGGPLTALGISAPLSFGAVVAAQVAVASPLYVRTLTAAFDGIDPDLLLVARSLGASPERAFLRVALPTVFPAVAAGVGLAGARAAGEFGATLLFAGSLPGVTQTLPLALMAGLEEDVETARALALVLLALGVMALALVRLATRHRGPGT